uniref:Replication protein A OB domain-containing protein n=1 Tax=Trichogramma kaykai TaxID=54128 RepID=A0ABD2WAI7_9HYME
MAENKIKSTPLMALTPFLDKHFSIIQANEKYNNLKNEFEILLTDETTIHLYNESITFYKNTINYEDLSEILKKQPNTLFNTTAIVKNIQPLVNHSTRTKKDYIKQDIELINDTNFKIILTLWGRPKNLDLDIFKIYLFTNLRITQGNYSKGLNTIVETTAIEDTESPIAIKLLPILQNMIRNNNQTNTFQNTNDFESIDDDLLCTAMEEFEKTTSTTLNTTINESENIANTTMDEILHNVFTTTGNIDPDDLTAMNIIKTPEGGDDVGFEGRTKHEMIHEIRIYLGAEKAVENRKFLLYLKIEACANSRLHPNTMFLEISLMITLRKKKNIG